MAKIKSSKPLKTEVAGSSKLPAETSVVSSTTPDNELTKSAALTPKDSGLDELFLSSLKDIYWAEKHLVKSLPIMIDAAGGSQLQAALTEHLAVTKNQVERLEQVFSSLGEKIVAQKCDAMEGLTISGENIIENTVAGSEARDTGLVMSGLKVENFEITSYKGLIQVASKLGYTDVATLFQTSLEEEVEAESILNSISANS